MVIASIDIQGGKVVQLRQGEEMVLQRDDAEELAGEFDRYGEVTVIDIDAAQGTADINMPMIKPLLRRAECRVGGGIRTVRQAKELVSQGAVKIIVASAAFQKPDSEEFGLNTAFLGELARAIGRERLIIAVDARDENVVVDGWKTTTSLGVVAAAVQADAYASELLFTCVDRDGMMTGIDFDLVKKLRQAVSGRLTVAGGVSSLEEIEDIAALGCDIQLGMALYTGKLQMADAFVASLNWNRGDLLPMIVQAPDGQVLTFGFANRGAVTESFKLGKICFYDRGRNKLAVTGENTGKYLKLIHMRADCNRDTILAVAEASGPVCHTGSWTCFEVGRRLTWQYLAESPALLTAQDLSAAAEKLGKAADKDATTTAAADLLCAVTGVMNARGVSVEDVLAELDRRNKS